MPPIFRCEGIKKKFWRTRRNVLYSNSSLLTLYLTIPTFNDPKKEAFWKHCGETSIFSFFPRFLPIPKHFSFSFSFNLLLAIAFNIDLSRILSFPKQSLIFTCLQYKFFENTVGKGDIARNQKFLFFQQYFLPLSLCHFYKIWNCGL